LRWVDSTFQLLDHRPKWFKLSEDIAWAVAPLPISTGAMADERGRRARGWFTGTSAPEAGMALGCSVRRRPTSLLKKGRVHGREARSKRHFFIMAAQVGTVDLALLWLARGFICLFFETENFLKQFLVPWIFKRGVKDTLTKPFVRCFVDKRPRFSIQV
jgi:hypothetical protein